MEEPQSGYGGDLYFGETNEVSNLVLAVPQDMPG
jgi:hypothetical protein